VLLKRDARRSFPVSYCIPISRERSKLDRVAQDAIGREKKIAAGNNCIVAPRRSWDEGPTFSRLPISQRSIIFSEVSVDYNSNNN